MINLIEGRDVIMKGLGEAIKSARKARRISQEKIANEAGLTTKTWISIEKEQHENPTIETVAKMANVLGVSILISGSKIEVLPAGTTLKLREVNTAN